MKKIRNIFTGILFAYLIICNVFIIEAEEYMTMYNVPVAIKGVSVIADFSSFGTSAVCFTENIPEKDFYITSYIKMNDAKYDIKVIKENALSACKEVERIVFPSTVEKYEANIFEGAENLKTIAIKSSKIPEIDANIFEGFNTQSVTIELNQRMDEDKEKAFKDLFRAAGFKGFFSKVEL